MNSKKKITAGMLAVVMALPISTAASAARAQQEAGDVGSVVSPEAMEKVVQLVMKEGATRGQAEQIVASLEPEDIAVYADNPEMMESGGILFLLLLILLICALISNTNAANNANQARNSQ